MNTKEKKSIENMFEESSLQTKYISLTVNSLTYDELQSIVQSNKELGDWGFLIHQRMIEINLPIIVMVGIVSVIMDLFLNQIKR